MTTRKLEIINKLGLHARAASKFVSTASGFQANINVSNGNRNVNAKSIMGIMMLAASKGTVLTLDGEGEDAEAAMDALIALAQNKFDEAE